MVNLPADDIEAVAAYLAEHGDGVAAILTEPVQGAGGVYPPPEGYLAGLRRLADQHGCYLIFDEVICGFGRLGRWFGGEHFGVQADLTTFAKAVTSGYVPLGGVVVAPSVRAPLEADETWLLRHGHTYSGHPTACAAALANLRILKEEGLVERAAVVGQRLFEGFGAIAADGRLAEVRSEVAVGALKLTPDHDAFAVRDALMAAGVLTRAVNPRPSPGARRSSSPTRRSTAWSTRSPPPSAEPLAASSPSFCPHPRPPSRTIRGHERRGPGSGRPRRSSSRLAGSCRPPSPGPPRP